MINSEQFIKKFVEEFPQYRAQIYDSAWLNLPNLQLGMIREIVDELIKSRKYDILKTLFTFFENGLINSDSELRNSIAVSFLEHLNFKDENGIEAFNLLPKNLKMEYESVEDYNSKLLSDDRLKNFIDDLFKEEDEK